MYLGFYFFFLFFSYSSYSAISGLLQCEDILFLHLAFLLCCRSFLLKRFVVSWDFLEWSLISWLSLLFFTLMSFLFYILNVFAKSPCFTVHLGGFCWRADFTSGARLYTDPSTSWMQRETLGKPNAHTGCTWFSFRQESSILQLMVRLPDLTKTKNSLTWMA